MGGDATRIRAFRYLYGVDPCLELAINEMKPPGIIVAWEDTLPATLNGDVLFKHRYNVYIRLDNQSQASSPLTYGYLWRQIISAPVLGGTQNIRYVELLPEVNLMDTPGIMHAIDETRMDYCVGQFVFPEKGDS